MGFQIKNKEGEAIGMNTLDAEVCALWGKEVKPKYYADPVTRTPKPAEDATEEEKQAYRLAHREEASKGMSNNWFDRIGYLIHEGADTWEKVKEAYLAPTLAFMEPHKKDADWAEWEAAFKEDECINKSIALIEHWAAKGYTPVPFKD